MSKPPPMVGHDHEQLAYSCVRHMLHNWTDMTEDLTDDQALAVFQRNSRLVGATLHYAVNEGGRDTLFLVLAYIVMAAVPAHPPNEPYELVVFGSKAEDAPPDIRRGLMARDEFVLAVGAAEFEAAWLIFEDWVPAGIACDTASRETIAWLKDTAIASVTALRFTWDSEGHGAGVSW